MNADGEERARQPFPGGFLVTDGTDLARAVGDAEPPGDLIALVEGWRQESIGRYTVRFDATWPVARAVFGQTTVLLLGTAVHVDRPELDDDAIASALAVYADHSWDAFLDTLDLLGGAHLIFVRTGGGRTLVLQDATGVEGLCYDVSASTRILASHPALIAELRGYEMSELARWWLDQPVIRAGGYYFPGLLTAFDEVRILTPNTALDLDTLEVERFFPREQMRERRVSDIVAEVAPRLQSQYRRLLADGPVAVSLSGGLDSRLTLAAARDVAHDVRWFTYVIWNSGVHQNDGAVASELAERFGLTHDLYRVKRGTTTVPAWERTHRGVQGGDALAGGLLEHFPPGHLHVRSNVLETVRGFYLKNSVNHRKTFDPYTLSRLFRMTVAHEFEPHFEEFGAVTGFGPDALKGLQFSDLFYWEHRMGAWHGGLVRGLKVVHRTHTLYNCRAVLTAMMARPLAERAAATVVWAMMDELWPDVLATRIYSGSKFIDPPAAHRLGR